MKSKPTPVTMQAIAKLIDKKFSESNGVIFAKFAQLEKRFDGVDTKILGIYSEIDGVKQQIISLDYGLNLKINNLEKKMDQNFEIVFDGLTNLGTILDLDHEKRIKRLETKIFA